MKLPEPGDIVTAAERIAPYIVQTPLLNSPALDELIGGKLLFKAESLQRTGSFKLRGAFNRLLRMEKAERQRGVVAGSAGNHGQGVAFAGRELGVAVTIVLPSDAPQAKIEGIRRWGAEIKFYDRPTQDREAIVDDIAERTGAVHVHPFDDPDIIAGQGTAAFEAFRQAAEITAEPSVLLCPTGGGGLIAGCGLAAEQLGMDVALHPCEPDGFDDTGRSLAEGQRVRNDMAAKSICDALLTPTPGTITFAINRSRLAKGLTVNDDLVRKAMRIGLSELKLVIEPGGAAGLAAAMKYSELVRGRTTIILVTGGNMDLLTIAGCG